MRIGTINTSKTFPLKEGDKLIFRNRHGRVTSVHNITYVDTISKVGNVAFTQVKDVR